MSFKIVTTGAETLGDKFTIYARGYTGAAAGGESHVNGTASSNQFFPAITDGGYVITWQAANSGSSAYGASSRTFSAPQAGSQISVATAIDSGTPGDDVFLVAPGGLGAGDEVHGDDGNDRIELSSAGTLDLTSGVVITGVEELRGSAGDDTLIVSRAGLGGIATIDGAGGDDTLVVNDRFIDLSALSLAGIEHVRAGATGATVRVADEAQAALLDGSGGAITVDASAFALTAEQRETLFGNGVGAILQPGGVTYLANGTVTARSGASAVSDAGESTSGLAVAAAADGSYVVTWAQATSDGWDIFARQYDASGTAVGPATLVNTTTNDDQETPSVAILGDGGYVVTWSSANQDDSGVGVYARHFDANGVGDAEFLVNSFATNDQTEPCVTALSDGGYVIVWMSNEQDGSGWGVHAQRYDAAGVASGDEVRINSTTAGDQQFPSVTALTDGGYVVTWMSSNQDGSGDGIYAQRFDASGAASGGEVLVNTTTAGNQQMPAVAALVDGGYIVTWMSEGQDGSEWGVYAQRYNASGVASGDEFRVNTTTVDSQDHPSVAGLPDGGFVVLWHSTATSEVSGTGSGIYAQRYDAGGQPIGSETFLDSGIEASSLSAVAGLPGGGYVGIFRNGAIYQNLVAVDFPDNPVASADSYDVAVDGSLSVDAPGVLANDMDGDGDLLTAVLVTGPEHGTLALNDDGSFTYTPDASYMGTDSFTYKASDGGATSAETTVSIDVGDVNDAPVANDDALNTVEDTPLIIAALDLTANDTDEDDDTVAIDSVTAVSGGTVVLNGDGTVTFTPDADFFGEASFTYTASDGSDPSNEATVTIEVSPVNDTPEGLDQTRSVAEDGLLILAVGDFDFTDVENDALQSVIITTLPTAGSLTLDGVAVTAGQEISAADIIANKLVFAPAPGASGSPYASFTFQVRDSGGGDDLDLTPNTVTFNVSDVAHAPAGVADAVLLNENAAAAADVLANDTDADAGDSKTLVSLATLAAGDVTGLGTLSADDLAALQAMFSINSTTQKIDFDPGAGLPGSESIFDRLDPGQQATVTLAYTFQDSGGLTGAAELTVTIDGQAELFVASPGGGVLNGSAYVDRMEGGIASDTLNGLGGNDELLGGADNDTLNGGAGNDLLNGGAGADAMNGGADSDTYFVDNAGDTVTEANVAGVDTVNSSVSFSVGSQFIENVTLTGTANISATGNAQANVLIGNSGNNTLNGNGGADTMQGLGGHDLYGVHDLTDVVDESVAGSGGIDTVNATVNVNLSDAVHFKGDIENVTLLGAANLNATGNALANVLIGNSGNNTLNGNAGADTMRGLAGDDVYGVHDLTDIVDESVPGSGGTDTVNAVVTVSLADAVHFKGNIENVTLLGAGNINATGNALDNVLIGNSGANTLDGGAGADLMRGLGGNDLYGVREIIDVVDESAGGSSGIDRVNSLVNFSLVAVANAAIGRGAIEAVILVGTADAFVYGNGFANVFIGNSGSNVLAAGAGNDTLTGGDGNDFFLFNTALNATTNVDTITDMNEAGDDTIRLENAIFTALGPAGALASGAFQISTTGAVDADDRIIYNSVTGELFYDLDGNAAGGPIKFATLDSGLALTAADFAVV